MSKNPPIYTWSFESTQPRAGKIITYLTQLNGEGVLSCDCPGWVFKKKGQPRKCRHTRAVEEEAKIIFDKFKKGEDLGGVIVDSTKIKTSKDVLSSRSAPGFKRSLDI